MARPVSIFKPTPQEKEEPMRRVRAKTASQRDCLRDRIILLLAQGLRQWEVAKE